MTNYEILFQEQMNNPEFAKAYYEARIERQIDEILQDLKEKISRDEPKELLIKTIERFQKQLQV
jgi:polyhydroxyalkanoate synthesis regulator phasin